MTKIAERMKLVRAAMVRQQLDGFIVPRADEFQGEYVPPSAERLAWLTGFTGSAGMAVVLADHAALCVDGRYTLQAPAETDTELFEVVQVPPASAMDWIIAHAKPDARIGYDAALMTDDWVRATEKKLAKANLVLVAVPNCVDAVWADRPRPPQAAVEPHPLEFAGEDAAAKRLRIAEKLKEAGVASFVLTAPDSIAWLLNIRGGDVPHTPFALSFAVLHESGEVDWFIDGKKLTDPVRAHIGNAVRVQPPADFMIALRSLSGRVGVDTAAASAAVVAELGERAQRLSDPCVLPKAMKNAVEVDGARRAHSRDGVALVRFFAWLAAQPVGSVDELAVMAKLLAFRQQGQHYRDLSFATIAGSGPNGAIVHYHANAKTNRTLQTGEFLLLDSGGQYRDGTTDVTRTVAIGSVSDEMRERYTRVLQGHIALACAVFPQGTTGHQLDAFARLPLWRAGLDFAHGTGHGVGSYLSVHEGPQRIASRPVGVPLEVGMIISNEPGYYKTGAYGIRLENLVVVQPRDVAGAEQEMLGFETLTLCPFDRHALDVALLSAGEKVWLNAYHKRVREAHLPHLSPPEQAWLLAATAEV